MYYSNMPLLRRLPNMNLPMRFSSDFDLINILIIVVTADTVLPYHFTDNIKYPLL